MKNDLLLSARTLPKGAVRRVPMPLGRRLECITGALWLTQDGDRRDVVLGPGDAFDFDSAGDALVSALADSRYVLLEPLERRIAY